MADPEPKFLKAKFQIGSCKGPINHAPDVAFFHPDDIPSEKKANRIEVVRAAKPDLLGQYRPGWNSTVGNVEPLCLRRMHTNSEVGTQLRAGYSPSPDWFTLRFQPKLGPC